MLLKTKDSKVKDQMDFCRMDHYQIHHSNYYKKGIYETSPKLSLGLTTYKAKNQRLPYCSIDFNLFWDES